RHRPTLPRCPYTTLFRSDGVFESGGDIGHPQLGSERLGLGHLAQRRGLETGEGEVVSTFGIAQILLLRQSAGKLHRGPVTGDSRSEEHTSELQSRFALVC